MAKRAAAGDLRTKIQICAPLGRAEDGDGYPTREYASITGDQLLRCKWVNAHGREVYDARQVGVEEPATLTLRYRPGVTADCVVYRDGDSVLYEVISVNDVENRHIWLELKVQRKGTAV